MAPQTDCTVMDLKGPYVQCAPGPMQAERWLNLALVVEMVKQPKEAATAHQRGLHGT